MSMNVYLWLFLTLFCIFTQAFYSMLEMASVSFNRVRLQYYVSKGVRRALWLQTLLQKPSRLFGTIMLMVNIALQVGSQSSREFYRALHLDPDIAPITQVFLVVVFAEVIPLIAARKYAEHVAMLGIPIVYATYKLLAPLIWVITLLSRLAHRLFGGKEEALEGFLTREELQKIVQSHEEGIFEGDEFNLVVSNIFSLRNKSAEHVMTPLENVAMTPSNATIGFLREHIEKFPEPYIPIYHKLRTRIVAIAFIRNLVRPPENRQVREFARPPWFITKEMPLINILKQFRRNNQSVAVVLDSNGSAVGILTLNAILEEIFGELMPVAQENKHPQHPLIERTFPGDMKIADFNREYGAEIDPKGAETLAQLMFIHLGHHPEQGEGTLIGPYEFIAEETTLFGIKSITVKSLEF